MTMPDDVSEDDTIRRAIVRDARNTTESWSEIAREIKAADDAGQRKLADVCRRIKSGTMPAVKPPT